MPFSGHSSSDPMTTPGSSASTKIVQKRYPDGLQNGGTGSDHQTQFTQPTYLRSLSSFTRSIFQINQSDPETRFTFTSIWAFPG
ncbi:hypothetical protein Bca101_091013 [Brassica carinata]